jgi:hypothetical protein
MADMAMIKANMSRMIMDIGNIRNDTFLLMGEINKMKAEMEVLKGKTKQKKQDTVVFARGGKQYLAKPRNSWLLT